MASNAPGPRVGYVLKKFPRLSETFILNEILGLEARGADVAVHSLRLPDEGRFHSELARLRTTVDYLPEARSQSTYSAISLLGALPHALPEGLRGATAFCDRLPEGKRLPTLLQGIHLAERVRREGLTHLHAHFMTVAAHVAYVAHRLTGVRFSVTAHAKDIYRHTVDRAVFAEMAAAAHAVITVCEANRRFIATELLQGAPARLETVYNGLPLEDFEAAASPADDLVLGIGRLVEKKGFDRLVEACALVQRDGRSFECLLVGEGDERPRLQSMIRDAGLSGRVRLAGATARDEVLQWLRRATLLVAPCVTGADGNRDALPTVIAEAMAIGVPVIATPVGGIEEMITPEEEGLLVPEGDVPALAAAMHRLFDDADLRARLAAAGRRKARSSFDRESQIDRLMAVFGIDRRETSSPEGGAT